MIYFNSHKEAVAFEIPDAIAEVDDAIWREYCPYDCGVDWDIIDGQFVPLTTVEVLKQRETAKETISECKRNLAQTDYQAIKYSEGQISEQDYAPIKAQRQAWRDEINRLEELLKEQTE